MSSTGNAEDKPHSLGHGAAGARGLVRCAVAALAVLAVLACVLQPAKAQTGLGVGVGMMAAVSSEYVARGMSLSRGRPAPQVRVDFDAGGWYAGALLARLRYGYGGARTQGLAYAGYAGRLPSGLNWEAGALQSTLGGSAYRYHELYAGLAADRLAGRVYYSPSYYGDAATVYAELNGSAPLRDGLALVGHLGLLNPLGSAEDEARRRVDLRVGLSLDSGNWNLQLALLANLPRRHGPEAPRALHLSASYGF
jgi:uncharacterized protein (TIGR02001 family)